MTNKPSATLLRSATLREKLIEQLEAAPAGDDWMTLQAIAQNVITRLVDHLGGYAVDQAAVFYDVEDHYIEIVLAVGRGVANRQVLITLKDVYCMLEFITPQYVVKSGKLKQPYDLAMPVEWLLKKSVA